MSANQYDFLNLSPFEFELLTCDFLGIREGLHFEAFTDGADGGVDLRHSNTPGKNIIVQCKRYKSWSGLKGTLEREVEKVQKLNPERYLLVTSVAMTAERKNQIKKQFAPYILSTEDILGKEDLNTLLRQEEYEHVLKTHFKLWLSSTVVMERILHSRVHNQSMIEKDKLGHALKVYVQNDSFNKALDILQDNRFVILSGIPGIGKTTLARILAYHFLANDYQEFIYVSDGINDAYEMIRKDTKQVFFFDDFLGTNFLLDHLQVREEKRLIAFIQWINNSKDKILILTTREYILQQAQQTYESFLLPPYPSGNGVRIL